MPTMSPNSLPDPLTLSEACAAAPFGMMALDRGLVVRSVNDSACRLLAAPRETLEGQALYDALPRLEASTRPLVERALQTGHVSMLSELPSGAAGPEGDGERFWNGACCPIFAATGDVAGVLVHFYEVTAKVQARLSEAQRAAELDAIFDTITDGIAVISEDGRITRFNVAGERILRGPAPDALPLTAAARFYTVRDPQTGDDIPPAQMAGARALAGEIVLGQEQMLRDGAGRDVIVTVSAAPLRDPDTGVLRGAVSMFRDITHVKRLEAEAVIAYARARRIAQTLQESLLPEEPMALAHHSMGQAFEPAWIEEADVGGDLLDFFVTGRGPTRRAHLMMADVSGKGLMAARRTALIKYTVKALATAGLGPQAVVGQLNDALEHDAHFDGFVTLFYAVFQEDAGQMTYVNAGHEPGLLWQGEAQTVRALGTTGMPLGVMHRDEGARWRAARAALCPADALLLYTDGFTEASGPGSRRMLGEDEAKRLFRASLAQPDGPAAVRFLRDAIHAHAGPRLRDDLALLLLRGHDVCPRA